MSRIVGAGEYLEEYGRVYKEKEGKVALLLRKNVGEVIRTMYYHIFLTDLLINSIL